MQKGFKNRKEGIQRARKAQGDMSFITLYFFFPHSHQNKEKGQA